VSSQCDSVNAAVSPRFDNVSSCWCHRIVMGPFSHDDMSRDTRDIDVTMLWRKLRVIVLSIWLECHMTAVSLRLDRTIAWHSVTIIWQESQLTTMLRWPSWPHVKSSTTIWQTEPCVRSLCCHKFYCIIIKSNCIV